MSEPNFSSRPSTPTGGDDFTSATALVRTLIETRTFRKEKLDDADTTAALRTLGEYARAAAQPALRLEAVSLLGKAGEISKPIAVAAHQLIEQGLQSPLPPIDSWGNADDRYYLAKGVSVSRAAWVKDYAAAELARAEVAEKSSREVWADLAVTRADTLAEALRAIGEALSAQLEKIDDASDTAYRKLIRIAGALSQTLLTADVPTGNGFGKAFSSLVLQGGGGRNADTQRLREEAANTVLELLIQILRLRFDALLDSDLYRAAGSVRGWWRPARPPDQVEQKSDRIVRLAFDGLHVLARQGVRDKELRQAIVAALGKERANAAGHVIASEDPSLDPKISRWLATGQELIEPRTNETVEELNDQRTDELIARLMLILQKQDAAPGALRIVAEAFSVFEPADAAVVQAAANRLELIDQWVGALAAKRRLSTFLRQGEAVPFDPAIHDGDENMQRLSSVVVVAPGVTRTESGRPSTVVLKAVVQKM